MEKFDLEKYNSGNYNVCTEDKKRVRIICVDARAVNGRISSEPIVALVSDSDGVEYVKRYSITGICSATIHHDEHANLMLVKKIWRPEMHEEYWYLSPFIAPCNTLYTARKEEKELFLIGNCFRTKEEALEKSKEIMHILKKEDEDEEYLRNQDDELLNL